LKTYFSYTESFSKMITITNKPNCFKIVVVVLPDLFRGMSMWRNFTETQHSVHAPIKVWIRGQNERSIAKDGAPEGLKRGIIQKVN